jgi:nitrate/nitrite transporter NarK
VAVAFVSMLKLASHWFTPRQFTLASGMALFVGIVGGLFAGVPLRLLVEAFGWRPVMAVSAAATALLCAAIWLRVRDDPAEAGYASHFSGTHGPSQHGSIWRGLLEVLSYRNIWLLMITPGGIAGAVMTFAGLWGVPWLMQVYGLGAREAAAVASAQLVAWALGGPLLGTWSERIGRRKPLYVATSLLAVLGWALAIYVPGLPLPLLVGLLMLLGFVSGSIIIGFAYAKESVPLRLTGTASGLTNMGTMMGVMILQPAVGWMLDRHWSGAAANGVRTYDAAAWQDGFTLVFAWVAVSLVCIALTRETGCRQTE